MKTSIIGGLYNPPKPLYSTETLLSNIDDTLEEILTMPSSPTILLAGDFNRLPTELILQMGLRVAFEGPTHEGHALDRVYASDRIDNICSTVKSTVKTKHSAVFVAPRPMCTVPVADRIVHEVRLRTPDKMASLQNHLESLTWDVIGADVDIGVAFAQFYTQIMTAVDLFFPVRKTTVRTRDPPYMTPHLKLLLRRRNRLFRSGQHEAASALADRIQKVITKTNASSFEGLRRGSRKLWTEVRRLRSGCANRNDQ